MYQAQNQYDQALEYFEQALNLNRDLDNRTGEGVTLDNIADLYARQGRYSEALELYLQALEVRRESGDWVGEGTTLLSMASVHRDQGRYEEALTIYQQALTLFRELGNHDGELEVIVWIGRVHLEQGRFAKALDMFQQGLAIARDTGDWGGEASCLNNIGAVYQNQARYAEALEIFQQALVIEQETGDLSGEGITLNNIALMYHYLGSDAEALKKYQEALDVMREAGGHACRACEGTSVSGIGSIYFDEGRYEEALNMYEQALAIHREVNDRGGEAHDLNRIASVYRVQDHDADAFELYQQALTICREIGDRDWEGATLYNIGRTYQAQGYYAEALDAYRQAMDALEEVRAVAGSEQGRASFIAQYAGLYARAVELLHKQGQDEEAFFTSERNRARAFLDSLVTGHVELTDNEAANLLVQKQEAYVGRDAAREALARARVLDPPDRDLIADLEGQLDEAEMAYAKVITEIEARGDQLAALIPGQSSILQLSEVQDLLDEETTLISYFILEDDILVFLITPGSFRTVTLNVSSEDLTAQVRAFRDFADPSFPAYPDSVVTLYVWLTAPLKEYLNTPHLAIVPHGVLHYLPFAALTDGQHYLIDDYVLTTLPSASALPFIQENIGRELTNPFILGNPTTGDFDATASFATEGDGLGSLPFAEKEARAIAALYGVEPLLGEEATEGAVQQRAGQAGILHLAAHGYYNPVAPLSSLIALAPDDNNDGWLTVGEVYGLDLSRADLVVLSACQTNLGELSEGDELVGLTRAFFFAGTPTVVASLWGVEDEPTALLMERFYTHLRQGMGKAAALRQAQLEVRDEYRNPYYWAGFVLSGDGGDMSDVQPTISGEVVKEATETAAVRASPAAPQPTQAAPEPVTEEQASQTKEEGASLRQWSVPVGGLLLVVLIVGGATLWRRRKMSNSTSSSANGVEDN